MTRLKEETATFEEFLASLGDTSRAEWVEGKVEWLWQSPLPSVMAALREMGVG
jgi:hypothetical protein